MNRNRPIDETIDDVTAAYGLGYQRSAFDLKTVLASQHIARCIIRRYSPMSVFDVGAGAGALIRAMNAIDANVACGVDGSQAAVALSDGLVKQVDLRTARPEPIRRHLITCFDVAEHLEHQYSWNLVRYIEGSLLYSNSSKVLFGPARDGQDGHGHVNCQHPCYWIEKFEGVGMELLSVESERLRTAIKSNDEHAHLWWIAQNLLVFRRKQ